MQINLIVFTFLAYLGDGDRRRLSRGDFDRITSTSDVSAIAISFARILSSESAPSAEVFDGLDLVAGATFGSAAASRDPLDRSDGGRPLLPELTALTSEVYNEPKAPNGQQGEMTTRPRYRHVIMI